MGSIMMQTFDLIGASPPIRALREEIAAAARSDAKVLLTGESGAGKEVVARLIHAQSSRRGAPLVTINCAGLPETLLETELFGHVRGSFTGAYRDKAGLLELANRGTVFMDEIGEMTLHMQSLLLRFLETGETQRVGSSRAESKLNVRVITATNRNLTDRIGLQLFREDLYYRLNVIQIAVPPLRERSQDVQLLVDYFLNSFCAQYRVSAPAFSSEALSQLSCYSWPGNVRELKNVVERLVVRFRSGTITPADLPSEIAHVKSAAVPPGESTRSSLADAMFERMINGRQSFWSVVYPSFISRDITRDDLRMIVSRGLEETRGNYRSLTELFNMESEDYKRFLNFLRKHQCQMPFQRFRGVMVKASNVGAASSVGRSPKARAGGG